MKITNLEIANFYGISTLTDSPEKINVLLAPNGSGKTTYLKALNYALTGDIRGEDFIKSDCSAAMTSITFDGHTISREKSRSGTAKVKLNGKTTTQKSINELYETLGVIPDAVKLVSSSEVLGAMEAESLSKFFLESGLIPISIDVDRLTAMCAPLSIEAENEIRNYFPESPEAITLDDINKAYTDYFDMRKSIKAEAKELKAKLSTANELYIPEMTLSEVDAKLLEIDSGIALRETQMYNDALKRREEIRRQIEEIDVAIAKSSATRSLKSELDFTKEKITEIRNEYKNIQKTIAVLEANLKTNDEVLANIATSHCPIHKDIVCTSDKSAVKELLEDTQEKTRAELNRLTEELRKADETLAKLDKRVAEYYENEKAYNAKLELIRRKKLLEDSQPPLPKKPTTIVDATKAEEQKKAFTEIRRRIILHEEALKNKERYEALEKQYNTYNELVEKFSPKFGIRELILDMALEPLMEVCNETAKKLKIGFEIKADLSKGFSVKAKTDSSTEFHPFDNLSNGEKVIVELLVMDMLNQLTGFNILILDNLDTLDAETFSNVMELVASVDFTDRYDHIFIAAVDHDDTKSVIAKYPVHKIM